MFKVKNFDYDLWTTDDGKCFVRVKRTGEVCEVDIETMRLLRSEEKRIYRELELKKNLDSDNLTKKTKAAVLHPLSIDFTDNEDEEESIWLQSFTGFEEDYLSKEMEKEFICQLNDNQKEIFICIMIGGEKQSEFAKRKGVKIQSVNESVKYIRKKAKKFFCDP